MHNAEPLGRGPSSVGQVHERRGSRAMLVRFASVLGRVPKYLKLAYSLAADPRVPARHRAKIAAGTAYVVSPLDPIPGVIPVVGQLDCLGVFLLSLRSTLRGAPPEVAAEHLDRAGLTASSLDADLRTLGVTACWLALGAANAIKRLGSSLVRLSAPWKPPAKDRPRRLASVPAAPTEADPSVDPLSVRARPRRPQE